MSNTTTVKPENVVPGRVIYSNAVQGGSISAAVQLSMTATVNIRSETGAKGEGDCDASHTLYVDEVEKQKSVAVPRFNDWNGIVETTMVFVAGKTYQIKAVQWNKNANAINTDLQVKVVIA
jgi:hypothetical protein